MCITTVGERTTRYIHSGRSTFTYLEYRNSLFERIPQGYCSTLCVLCSMFNTVCDGLQCAQLAIRTSINRYKYCKRCVRIIGTAEISTQITYQRYLFTNVKRKLEEKQLLRSSVRILSARLHLATVWTMEFEQQVSSYGK